MLTVSFQTALIAIAQIFTVGVIGFILTRKNIINLEGLKLLSFLSINITFPFFIFYQITHHFNPHEMANWWGYPLINITLMLVGILVSILIFLLAGKKPKAEFLAVANFHNAGYIPLLMAMSLPLGAMAGRVYAAVIISIIGFDLCLWSVGVWLLTKEQRPRFELKQMVNPPLVSMACAILLVLFFGNDFLPEAFFKPVKIVGDGAMALSMLVIGGNLALTSFHQLKLRSVGLAVAMKMCITPLCAMIFLEWVHLDPLMNFVVMLQACMPTAITLSIIGRHHNSSHQDFINQGIFITHLLCIITIPLFLGLYAQWVH